MSTIRYHTGLDEMVRFADDPDNSPWHCGTCGADIPFLRGVSWEGEGIFRGHCDAHGSDAHFIYADGSPGFCCAECRLQRDEPEDLSENPQESVKVFAEWCENCENRTNTAKIDLFQAEVWVCEECRTEVEEPDDISEKEECTYCGEETYTVEIGSGT